MNIEEKYETLQRILSGMGKVVIAFSGGVDSTFLLKAAHDVLGENVIAVTITSPFHPEWEIKEAEEIAKEIGVQQVFIPVDLVPEIKDNPPQRCYLCKKYLFQRILSYAGENGYPYVADGTNHDDTLDYRPGLKALKELRIRSPLLEAGLGKEEIRTLSKKMKLRTWDKPAYACLLTRIPYYQPVRISDLQKIQSAEHFLMKLGFRQVRVRIHDNLARIELGEDEFCNVLSPELLKKIHQKLKDLGFLYVTLDLEGYQTGKMNREIKG
ncbi:MAG TPA: ATP-dependent sacrificial sulfur transferase LarE [Clostridiales bacterium]|nr:ATP-dependent sacrificial sulfur transferase LarE [Clostridiales bacterium]